MGNGLLISISNSASYLSIAFLWGKPGNGNNKGKYDFTFFHNGELSGWFACHPTLFLVFILLILYFAEFCTMPLSPLQRIVLFKGSLNMLTYFWKTQIAILQALHQCHRRLHWNRGRNALIWYMLTRRNVVFVIYLSIRRIFAYQTCTVSHHTFPTRFRELGLSPILVCRMESVLLGDFVFITILRIEHNDNWGKKLTIYIQLIKQLCEK